MFNIDKFARLLSAKRKTKGLTQDQLADLVGVTHQAVSKWERAEAMPEISKIGDIALAIDTPAEELINTLYDNQPTVSAEPAARGTADEAYYALADKTRVGDIYALAPNLSKETLRDAINTVVAEKGAAAATMLFRFADEEYLAELGKTLFAKGDTRLAEYVDESTLKSAAIEYITAADTNDVYREKCNDYLRAGQMLVRCKDIDFINEMFDHMVSNFDTWNVWKSIIGSFPSEVIVHQGIKFMVRKGTSSFNCWWELIGRRNISKMFLGYADHFKNNAQAWRDIMIYHPKCDSAILESGIKERFERGELDLNVFQNFLLSFTPEMAHFFADNGILFRAPKPQGACPPVPQDESLIWSRIESAIDNSTDNPSLLRARKRFEEEFDIKLQESDVKDWPEIIKWADIARKELYPEYDTPDNAILKEILKRLENIEQQLDDVESVCDDLDGMISDLEDRIDELE